LSVITARSATMSQDILEEDTGFRKF